MIVVVWNKRKTPSATACRGREDPVVPPQFTACAALWDTSISLALYRARPSLLTAISAGRSGENSDAASPLPRTGRQLSVGDALAAYLVPSLRWGMMILVVTLPLSFAEVNRIFSKRGRFFDLAFAGLIRLSPGGWGERLFVSTLSGATRPRTPGDFLPAQKVTKNAPKPRFWNPLPHRSGWGDDSIQPLNIKSFGDLTSAGYLVQLRLPAPQRLCREETVG